MALTKNDIDKIRETDQAMIRWICQVKLKDRLRSDILLDRLRIPDITEVCRRNRLRWYGHVQRNTGWTKRCTELMIEGASRRGGPRKKWQSLVDDDMKLMGIQKNTTCDRSEWRRQIHKRITKPTSTQ